MIIKNSKKEIIFVNCSKESIEPWMIKSIKSVCLSLNKEKSKISKKIHLFSILVSFSYSLIELCKKKLSWMSNNWNLYIKWVKVKNTLNLPNNIFWKLKEKKYFNLSKCYPKNMVLKLIRLLYHTSLFNWSLNVKVECRNLKVY